VYPWSPREVRGRAKALTEGPVLLIDHADNCASGGTQDTMAVVEEVMARPEDVAVFAICDPGPWPKRFTPASGRRSL